MNEIPLVSVTVARKYYTTVNFEIEEDSCSSATVVTDEPLSKDDYGKVVAAIVRFRYSADDVEAIQLNYIEGENKEEFEELRMWRMYAKQKAREAMVYLFGDDFEAVDSVEETRKEKLVQLAGYDNSTSVNGFFVGEQLTWIDRDTRNTYKASIEAAELLGESSIIVPMLGMILNIPIDKGKIALAKIQRYADACAIVTATHKMAISGLDSEEEIMGYDFTQGYPEKLVFDPTEYLN